MQISRQDKHIYIGLFILSFIIIFSSTYNPMNFRRMHVDSSVYITIAQGITRGQLPYMDFVDNKGPLAYLISAPGFYLGGFTGIWITELILMCVSVFFAFKTALFFGDRYKAFLGTVFSFIALLAFFIVNAGTEEYSLPFLMVSFYIFAKYFFSPDRNVRFIELIVLGICFACAVLIRLNMFPLWFGFCIVIIAETVIKRRFAVLGKYIAGFCLGIAIVFIPVFLYLNLNGIFDAFLSYVIFGGAAKGFSGSGLKELTKNFYIVVSRNFSFVPLFLGLFWAITKYRDKYFFFYAGYFLSYLIMVLFLSFSSGDSHYNLVLIPYYIPCLVFLTELIYSAFSGLRIKNVFLVFFFCFVLSEGLVMYAYNLAKVLFDNTGEKLIKTGRLIDENTNPGDKIISLGFNAYIYPFTQRDSASKYIYQGSGLDHISGAREEFIADILFNEPSIIAIFNDEDGIGQIMDGWHKPVLDRIETDYRLLSDENGFILYIRRNP